MNLTRTALTAFAALGLSLAAHAAPPAKMGDGMLMGSNGMTLYTFDKDSTGKSACNGPCAANWPPLMATDMDKAEAGYTVITREDGKKQWAYKDKPLYFWAKDAKAGDKTGDGINGVWHVAK